MEMGCIFHLIFQKAIKRHNARAFQPDAALSENLFNIYIWPNTFLKYNVGYQGCMLVRIASREDTDQIAVGLGLLRGNKCLKLPWVKISNLNCPCWSNRMLHDIVVCTSCIWLLSVL